MLIIGIQDADMGEFLYNFNFVTNHYYKQVDRNELLQKAFKTVIDELDDPYSQVLDESFKESMSGNDVSFGYGITIIGNDAYVSNVKDDSLGVNEKDKIVSINGEKVEKMSENEIKNIYANTQDKYEVEVEREGEIIKLELKMSVNKIQNITSNCFKIDNKRIAYIKMNFFFTRFR